MILKISKEDIVKTTAKKSTIPTSSCPCGEIGKDGRYVHSGDPTLVSIRWGNGRVFKINSCANHLPNYLDGGYKIDKSHEEKMAKSKPKKKVVKTTKLLSLKPPLVVRDNIVSSPKHDITLRRLFAFDGDAEDLRMMVKGTLGVVEFKVFMPKDSPIDDGDPIATIIGHSQRKLKGDDGAYASCKLLGLGKTKTCYHYDDETLGRDMFNILYSDAGSEGVWDYLTNYYHTVFTEAVTQGKIVISY